MPSHKWGICVIAFKAQTVTQNQRQEGRKGKVGSHVEHCLLNVGIKAVYHLKVHNFKINRYNHRSTYILILPCLNILVLHIIVYTVKLNIPYEYFILLRFIFYCMYGFAYIYVSAPCEYNALKDQKRAS